MRNIADKIEAYLKQLLTNNENSAVEIQRNELAQAFECAPSQINYVLGTRFTPEQGYLVETRRGGGGYVRIVKLAVNRESELNRIFTDLLGDDVSQNVAEGLIMRLREEGLLTARESLLMRSVVHRNTILLPLPERDCLRSRILKAMLYTVMRDDF